MYRTLLFFVILVGLSLFFFVSNESMDKTGIEYTAPVLDTIIHPPIPDEILTALRKLGRLKEGAIVVPIGSSSDSTGTTVHYRVEYPIK